MLLRERTNSRYPIVSALHGLRAATAKQLRLNPNRKKLRIKSAGLRAHRVKVAVAELFLNIDVLVQQSLRRVNVHVDCDGSLVYRNRVRRFFYRSILVFVIHVSLRTAGNKN
jgi:hypothetical protein